MRLLARSPEQKIRRDDDGLGASLTLAGTLPYGIYTLSLDNGGDSGERYSALAFRSATPRSIHRTRDCRIRTLLRLSEIRSAATRPVRRLSVRMLGPI